MDWLPPPLLPLAANQPSRHAEPHARRKAREGVKGHGDELRRESDEGEKPIFEIEDANESGGEGAEVANRENPALCRPHTGALPRRPHKEAVGAQ